MSEPMKIFCNACGPVEVQTVEQEERNPESRPWKRFCSETIKKIVPVGEACPKCKKLLWELIALQETHFCRSKLKLRTTHESYRGMMAGLPGKKIPKGRPVPFENDETIRCVTVQAVPELWQNAKFAKEFAGLEHTQVVKVEEKAAPALSAREKQIEEIKTALPEKLSASATTRIVAAALAVADSTPAPAPEAQELKDQQDFEMEVHAAPAKIGIAAALARFESNPKLWRAVKNNLSA